MEKSPKSGEHEVVETQYSEVFYKLVGQLENLKNRAEDPDLPAEDRKKAQDDLEKWAAKFEEEFDRLDAMDKEEQSRRIGSQSLVASELPGEQTRQKPEGRAYIDAQGFVHTKPEDAQDGPDDWRVPKRV